MKEQLHRITLNFSDGVSRCFSTAAISSILDAALVTGVCPFDNYRATKYVVEVPCYTKKLIARR
ncbi:hypothetical protein D3879_10420 [Pseudomonas cavernicola]|uniref:Uncharacterized protein n=1 Tax=Pseudomonas cavernicola TaxID=2320866 RepID=A0A418XMB5_9PSED|nr:hypothetical protein [Pseudomonas cavernicola]RJG13619.1 hypothetical protein D3879_10420 [Pseudomonas cavernicola]